MRRRDFLKAAGVAAGSIPVLTFFNGFAISEETGKAVLATSAVKLPSFCAPAIVQSGSIIPMERNMASKTEIMSAWLQARGSDKQWPLSADERDCCGHPYSLYSKTPVAPGLYDLFVEASRGGKSRLERQPNAVKVVAAFKDDFKFGVISDVHFGDPRLASKNKDFEVALAVEKEIGILNDAGVEFCLCCGDLTFLPPATKSELLEYTNIFSDHADFPVFTVPGNHDGYTTGAGARINFDTFDYWEKDFGQMDFEASYGFMSIIGVNTFDKSPDARNVYGGHGADADMGAVSDAQLKRLDKYFSDAKESGAKSVVIFGHHNPTNTVKDVNGPFVTPPFSETGRTELLGLISKYKPGIMFVGHVHGIHEETYADTRIVTVPTAASMPAEGNPVGIDIASVKNWKVTDIETVEIYRV